MSARASLAALFGFLLLAGFSGAAQAEEVGTLRGQLWLVSNTNLNATLPVPAAAPDATFLTRHISFAMSAPFPGSPTQVNNVNNTVEGFLSSGHPDAVPPVKDLAFSGLYNSVVGAVVDANTPVVNSTAPSCGTYGTYMTLEGTIQLANGEFAAIMSDNGVALWIDGVKVSGLSDLGNVVVFDRFTFSGLTGAHRIELIYVNTCGPGFLSFTPKM